MESFSFIRSQLPAVQNNYFGVAYSTALHISGMQKERVKCSILPCFLKFKLFALASAPHIYWALVLFLSLCQGP